MFRKLIAVIYLILFIKVQPKLFCGYDLVEYSSPDEAHFNGVGIMHCGTCGKCSNAHDISIYSNMANSLTRKTTYCAILSLLGIGGSCMKHLVKFTSPCLDCWMDNIKCTRKKCALTCIVPSLLNRIDKQNGTRLNKCLECDENNCGPAFKKCAGANRRRCGIKTDIGRPDDQLCSVVDPREYNWIK